MHADRTATPDPALVAVVRDLVPMRYAGGPSESLDRPGHVRAASGIARVPGGIAVVQDDANFIALVDSESGLARAVTLPSGPGGLRQFDATRGNKHDKLDFEACIAVADRAGDDGTLLVAFGSGSTRRREQVALVRRIDATDASAADVRLVHAPRLYEMLRSHAPFARGGDDALNLEGAVLLGDRLRLFTRGNGAPHEGAVPLAATCDVPWEPLLAHLLHPDACPPPAPLDARRYDLGLLDGVRLGFTDAAAWGDRVLFTAAAEASTDAVDDGDVAGSVLGVIDDGGRVRWTLLVDAQGAPFRGKVEGVLAPHRVHHDGSAELIAVVDADDPDAPSLLCTVRLEGPWNGPSVR